jgi:dipeptidyl aminopeptidase/acylaminoacyl peptidase
MAFMSFVMRMKPHSLREQLTNARRPSARVLAVIGIAAAFALTGAAAHAKTTLVDPGEAPQVILSPADADKLITLQSARFVGLGTDVSPDDAVVGTVLPGRSQGFLDLRSGAFTPAPAEVGAYFPLSETRWRDAQTVVFLGGSKATGELVGLIAIDRSTGAVRTTPVALQGYPLSLSPRAQKLLVVLFPQPVPASAPAARSSIQSIPPGPANTPVDPKRSPFDLQIAPRKFKRVGPAVFDADTLHSDQVASSAIQLAVIDLASGALQVLLDLPPGANLQAVSWSADDGQLAVVRRQFPDMSRGGQVTLDDVSTQDGLGSLRPDDNPLFTSSVVDLFTLPAGAAPEHRTLIRPGSSRHGDDVGKTPPIFAGASFSPDGQTVMAQLWFPGTPKGHRFPSYGNPNRSAFAFYSTRTKGRAADGIPAQATLDRPEIAAPGSNVPVFLSNDEIVFDAAFGPSWGLFVYDRKARSLRTLAAPEGAIYQLRPTHFSREIIFNQSSFSSPYEIYRLGLHDRAATALTKVNAEIAAVNQVRVDKVAFDVACGERRSGYLVQPAGAPFPPRDARIVVWQQGGPTAPMTNEWGGSVEQPFNLLPNFGIGVLVVPLPGREGFGPAFLDGLADGRNFGQVDIDEQIEIVGQMIDRGYTSPARLGITGCSYGGYFTSQSITRHPGIYAAANMQCSLVDLVDEWQYGFKPYISFLEGRTPVDQLAEYRRDSPSANASKVRTPVLIFDGTEDFLPYTLSQQFHDDVNAAGAPSDFLLFQGEGHGLQSPVSEFVAGQAQLEWFRRHLRAGRKEHAASGER